MLLGAVEPFAPPLLGCTLHVLVAGACCAFLCVQKIRDKYNPAAVDLREYQKAKAEGKLDEYWASKGDLLKELTGSSAPPVVAAS